MSKIYLTLCPVILSIPVLTIFLNRTYSEHIAMRSNDGGICRKRYTSRPRGEGVAKKSFLRGSNARRSSAIKGLQNLAARRVASAQSSRPAQANAGRPNGK